MKKENFLAVAFLFIVSFILRVIIVSVKHPNAVVFDETHFGTFINNYVKGEFFFDIHPPLAKLMLQKVAKINSYKGNFNFSIDESPYFNETKGANEEEMFYAKIRLFNAVISSFISPLLCSSLLLKGTSLFSSVLCGIVSTFDCLTITQGRLIVTDGILYFFVALTIFVTSLIEYRSKQKMFMKTNKHKTTIDLLLIILQGIAAGCAFSTKFAAGGVLAYIGFSHIEQAYMRCFKSRAEKSDALPGRETEKKNEKSPLIRFSIEILIIGSILISCVLFVLFGSFFIHFKLLPNSGPGDKFIDCTNKTQTCRFHNLPFIKKTIVMIELMLIYNRRITADHPYASRWYQWPLALTNPLLLYCKSPREYMVFYIMPTAAAASFIGFICSIYFRRLTYFVGYAFSFFPFAFIKRVTFIYHYEIPMMFGLLSFFASLDKFTSEEKFMIQVALIIITLVLFILFLPQLYCIYSPITSISFEEDQNQTAS